MQYKVTTTDLRIHLDHHTNSRVIGGLPRGKIVDVVGEFADGPVGKWMKLATGGWAYAGDQLQFLTLVAAGSATGAATGAEAIARHSLLFFGGACPTCPPGANMTPTNDADGPRTSQTAYEYFTRSGRFAAAPKWNSSVSNDASNPAVDAGLRFLQRPSLPGKLVIYGFSAGGFNAVRLCESIARVGRHVDLLITVVSCAYRT